MPKFGVLLLQIKAYMDYQSIIRTIQCHQARPVAVSKTHPNEKILSLYQEGQRIFGENRVQELVAKFESLPKDIQWHMIGSLQTNKVKYIAPFISLIHSIDSLRLLQEVNKEAAKNQRVIDCLLQFHIAQEETKHGFALAEAEEMLTKNALQDLSNVQICGVMGMAIYTSDQAQVKAEFRHLHQIFEHLKTHFFQGQPAFSEISMGMSGDWLLALEEGSTLIRIGSLLFGER